MDLFNQIIQINNAYLWVNMITGYERAQAQWEYSLSPDVDEDTDDGRCEECGSDLENCTCGGNYSKKNDPDYGDYLYEIEKDRRLDL